MPFKPFYPGTVQWDLLKIYGIKSELNYYKCVQKQFILINFIFIFIVIYLSHMFLKYIQNNIHAFAKSIRKYLYCQSPED